MQIVILVELSNFCMLLGTVSCCCCSLEISARLFFDTSFTSWQVGLLHTSEHINFVLNKEKSFCMKVSAVMDNDSSKSIRGQVELDFWLHGGTVVRGRVNIISVRICTLLSLYSDDGFKRDTSVAKIG